MALDAIAGRDERILAVVAGTTGFPFVHIAHFGLECACFVRKGLGVAVSAFVHAEVEFMAEIGFASLGLEYNVPRFVAFVALVALTFYRERVFTIVAGAAGFAALHASHGCLKRAGLVLEGLGVAVRAFEHADMHLMTEDSICYTFELESYFTRFHPFVAVAAVAGNCKRHLAVMTGSAGLAFFHLNHRDIAIPAGDDLAVMAAAAGESGL